VAYSGTQKGADVPNDDLYTYSKALPVEYEATLGNGHSGSIVEGPNQGANRLKVRVGVPVDGDVRLFVATAIRNPASPRKAILNIDVYQIENDGSHTNLQTFISDEEDFDGSGRAFINYTLMLSKSAPGS
jgi:hypothetical protein